MARRLFERAIGNSSPPETAAGILLKPAIGVDVDERVTIQGHEIPVAKIDLTNPSDEISDDLRRLVDHVAMPPNHDGRRVEQKESIMRRHAHQTGPSPHPGNARPDPQGSSAVGSRRAFPDAGA